MSARPFVKISTVQRQVNDYPEVLCPPTREVLSVERKQHCEGLVSVKECLEALNGMATEKTPDTDGLPCEFIKFFGKTWVKH